MNWVKFCAQGISGCQTISYTQDLIYPGITTSTNGDLWLNMLTYTSSAPIMQQLAIYRTASGTFLNAPVYTTINPTYWTYYPSLASKRCQYNQCFSAGEYMLPAMNTNTGASIPLVIQSPRLTDFLQTFVQDPQTGAEPLPGLEIGPVIPFGSNSTVSLSADQLAERKWKPYVTGLGPNSPPVQ